MPRTSSSSPLARLAAHQKHALLAHEQAVGAQLTDGYTQLVRDPLAPQISVLTDAYSRALAQVRQERGDPRAVVPPHWLLDANGGHIDGLKRSVSIHVGRFAHHSQDAIAHGAGEAAGQGTEHAQALLHVAVAPLRGRVADPTKLVKTVRGDAQFGLMQRLAAPDSSLARLLASLGDDAADTLYRALLAALATGQNPRALAMDLWCALDGSLQRARAIARNELISAYRQAALDQYRANSDVVQGWVWSAALGTACVMCSDLSGSVHPLDEDLVSHAGCRCAQLPLTRPWSDILGPLGIASDDGLDDTRADDVVPDGGSWFAVQDAATQAAILGPAGYQLYAAGEVDLSDFLGYAADGRPYRRSLREMGFNWRDVL